MSDRHHSDKKEKILDAWLSDRKNSPDDRMISQHFSDRLGRTPLHVACFHGEWEKVMKLVDAGFGVNRELKKPSSPPRPTHSKEYGGWEREERTTSMESFLSSCVGGWSASLTERDFASAAGSLGLSPDAETTPFSVVFHRFMRTGEVPPLKVLTAFRKAGESLSPRLDRSEMTPWVRLFVRKDSETHSFMFFGNMSSLGFLPSKKDWSYAFDTMSQKDMLRFVAVSGGTKTAAMMCIRNRKREWLGFLLSCDRSLGHNSDIQNMFFESLSLESSEVLDSWLDAGGEIAEVPTKKLEKCLREMTVFEAPLSKSIRSGAIGARSRDTRWAKILVTAAASGRTEICRSLVEKGAHALYSSSTTGCSPLSVAASSGKWETAGYLMGVTPEKEMRLWESAFIGWLSSAIKKNSLDFVEAVAKFDRELLWSDVSEKSPFMTALKAKNIDIVMRMVEYPPSSGWSGIMEKVPLNDFLPPSVASSLEAMMMSSDRGGGRMTNRVSI